MSFLEYNQPAAAAVFAELALPAFRLGQVRRWIFSRGVFDFGAMTDLSKSTRIALAERFGTVLQGRELARTSASDSTEKLLIEWPDGERVECVLLRDDRNHRTGCISTQVGCAMGCRFCASGMDGFVRNLTRGEILEQILRLNALLLSGHERLTHLVVMGIGEPLLNLTALLSALDDATASDGLDLSVRRVTISTVGIPKGIRDLADTVKRSQKASSRDKDRKDSDQRKRSTQDLRLIRSTGYKLAVSLHAPNDELRTSIIPQNRFTGIAEILSATDEYFARTGRRVTFEYTLLAGVNDGDRHARELVKLLRGRTAVVNVIPFNPVQELSFRTPSPQVVQRFVRHLESGGLQVKVRFRKGDGINAACGQLRRKHREMALNENSQR